MRVTDRKYLKKYIDLIGQEIPSLIGNHDLLKDKGGFEYITKSSAVFSSNIEGNSIDLNSYMNYEMNRINSKLARKLRKSKT